MKHLSAFLIGAGMMVSIPAVTLSQDAIAQSQATYFQVNPRELVDTVWQEINRTYIDKTFNQQDWQTVRSEFLGRSYDNLDAAYAAIKEMMAILDDPLSRFMTPAEFNAMRVDSSEGNVGIGLRVFQDKQTNEIVAFSPLEDTPAFEAGIQFGDIVTLIDEQSTDGMSTTTVMVLLRGDVNAEVDLTIKRAGEPIELTIMRRPIDIRPVKYESYPSPYGAIGSIRFTQFSANAASEMRDAIRELESEDVQAYVLDMRSNSGGLLYSSIEIARMWMDEGLIFSMINREGITDQKEANGRQLTDKPLAVLIDEGSSSASEILAGALQDNQRALLVGTATFGNNLIQSVKPLGDRSNGPGLAVTVAKWLTPNGQDINGVGLQPDIVVPLTAEDRQRFSDNQQLRGTLDDPQFAAAVDALFE
ncbi:MAG: S41 family peptidase [Cyanobacteria bacterium P01_F01_bin.150]